MTVELEVIRVGEVPTPLAWIERPEGRLGVLKVIRREQKVTLSMLAYVVRHPAAGTILIDTGLHPDVRESPRRDYGLIPSLIFGGVRPADKDFAGQLRERGVEAGDVRQVVMTHLHADHTSGMRLLPSAEFVISAREWAAATRRDAQLNGYAPGHLPDPARVRQMNFAGTEPHGPFEQTIDLLGDGSVRLISTPGHSPGHMSVLLRTATRPVFVLGDAVYRMRNLENEILPFRTVDDDRYRETVRRLREYVAETPEAVLIPTHDDEAWRAL